MSDSGAVPILRSPPDPPGQPAWNEITRSSLVRTEERWRLRYPGERPGDRVRERLNRRRDVQWTECGGATHRSAALSSAQPSENSAIQCANVVYDPEAGVYRMAVQPCRTEEHDSLWCSSTFG
jgi:hypothetical protein